MSEHKWKKLEEVLGVNEEEETVGVETEVPELRAEPKPKTIIPQRKAVKAKDPYL